jgi:transcriptional regulator with XRE-family HTH domain
MPRRAEDKKEAAEIAWRLGERARTARAKLNLTQEELSERVGVTPEALGRIERGHALPSFPTFQRLAAALGLSANELLTPERSAHRVEEKLLRAPRELQQISRYSARLDRRQQRVVLTVARELATLARPSRAGRKRSP